VEMMSVESEGKAAVVVTASTSSASVVNETASSAAESKQRTLRIVQEVFTLSNGLPLTEDGGIFLLTTESTLFNLKTL
ncbi:hypothetical protein DKP78_26550, partial [Enterococcus faecium]